MAGYLQAGRFLYVETPLGKDAVILKRYYGHEAISQLFRFELIVVAENSKPVDFSALLGQSVTFGVAGEEVTLHKRYLNGMVVEVSVGSRDKFVTTYTMTVVPTIWKLTQKVQSRIFQHKTIPQILKLVLQGYQ